MVSEPYPGRRQTQSTSPQQNNAAAPPPPPIGEGSRSQRSQAPSQVPYNVLINGGPGFQYCPQESPSPEVGPSTTRSRHNIYDDNPDINDKIMKCAEECYKLVAKLFPGQVPWIDLLPLEGQHGTNYIARLTLSPGGGDPPLEGQKSGLSMRMTPKEMAMENLLKLLKHRDNVD